MTVQLQKPARHATATPPTARSVSPESEIARPSPVSCRAADNSPPAEARPDVARNNAMGPRAAALDRFLRELCARIGSQRFDMWFAHTRLRINGQRLEVHTDSRFVANSIDSRFAVTLRSVAHQVLGPAFEIDMKVAPASEADQSQRPTTPASIASTGDAIPDSHAGANEHSAPRPRIKAAQFRRLEEFVVGTSNKLAYAAALRLSEQSDARCI